MPFTVDGVRDVERRVTVVEEKKKTKCESNSINRPASHSGGAEWNLQPRPRDPPATGNGFLSYTGAVAP